MTQPWAKERAELEAEVAEWKEISNNCSDYECDCGAIYADAILALERFEAALTAQQPKPAN